MLHTNRLLHSGVVGLGLLAWSPAAFAVDFAVTRYDDPIPNVCAPSQCSLREAVIAANQTAGPDRIILSAGVYELQQAGNQEDGAITGDLDLLDDVEILGVAANLTIIDGNFVVERVFEVPVVETIAVHFVDLAITGGNGTFGGSSLQVNRTDLSIDRCEFFGNLGGSATIRVLTFSTATIRDTTVRGNGAGIGCTASDCLLENVTVSDNGTFELEGGVGALLTCQHCTIYEPTDGTAIDLDQSALQIGDSVIRGTCLLPSGSFVFTAGGNLEAPGHTCSLTDPTDADDVFTAALFDLAANGGATLTRRPQIGAPSANGGIACEPAFDQTGYPRPAADCSRGATQAAIPRTLIPVFIDGFEQGDAEAWSAVID